MYDWSMGDVGGMVNLPGESGLVSFFCARVPQSLDPLPFYSIVPNKLSLCLSVSLARALSQG